MKTFLVEMDEICDMSIDFGGISGRRVCSSKNRYNDCEGYLQDRPDGCPLLEMRFLPAKTHDLDGNIWAEVERDK